MEQLLRSPYHTQIKKHHLIGKIINHYVTGMRVDAKVIAVFDNEHSITICTEHKPIRWGNDTFTKGSVTLRKSDNCFGKEVEVDKHLKLKFKQSQGLNDAWIKHIGVEKTELKRSRNLLE